MRTAQKQSIRNSISSVIKEEIALFRIKNGFSTNEEVAKFFGREKYWINNLTHKRDGIRTFTDVDLYEINQIQQDLVDKGRKFYTLNLFRCMTTEEKAPEVLKLEKVIYDLKNELKARDAHNNRLIGRIEQLNEGSKVQTRID